MPIKQEYHDMDQNARHYMSSCSPSDPSVRLCTVTNENWRGKNDPTERRRIQNRLNQRAFRERQRKGEPSKQYRPRNSSSTSPSQPDDDYDYDDDEADTPPSIDDDTQSSAPQGRVWDELAQLINRNLMAAASANAQHLGIEPPALRTSHPILTPRLPSTVAVPATLQPIPPQHQIAHDPIIDTIPHARLRFNVLRAVAAQQIDAAAFSRDLRASGALERLQGQGQQWQRGGLIVWSAPEQLASWELSEGFMRKYGGLLQGCEDLVAATNVWRSRRGERLFSLPSSGGGGR